MVYLRNGVGRKREKKTEAMVTSYIHLGM